jgi:FkbM family methyltransferase
MMARAIHTFDNGVRVFEDQLWEGQRARYRKRNVHEAEEEDIFVDLIRRLPRNGCYVDVGAAIGYYLILARKLAPHLEIHGVEPLQRHWHLLRENLALNDLVVDDFKIHPEALTSTEGTEIFMDRGYSSRLEPTGEKKEIRLSARWKRFLESIGLRKPKNITLTIPTITVDTLVKRIGRPIDLLQMDVQGLEVEVLRGSAKSMSEGAIRTFLIGTHGRMIGVPLHHECRELLQAAGYTIEIDQPDTKEQPDGILVARK